MQMFIAAFFIHKCQNLEARCPLVGEQIDKLWYIQIMEYYLMLKGNEPSSHEKTKKKLKCILLSERSQSEKVNYCRILT